MGEVEEPVLSEVEMDLLPGHRGTDIPVEKRIPPLRCASVGMTTLFGQADLEGRNMSIHPLAGLILIPLPTSHVGDTKKLMVIRRWLPEQGSHSLFGTIMNRCHALQR
jgi:hypothetical protein